MERFPYRFPEVSFGKIREALLRLQPGPHCCGGGGGGGCQTPSWFRLDVVETLEYQPDVSSSEESDSNSEQ